MNIPIPFKQYLMPDGRTRWQWIERPEPIGMKALELQSKGYQFEIEMLQTGEISMEIVKDGHPVAGELCPNGPQVPACIDRMIEKAYEDSFENRQPK